MRLQHLFIATLGLMLVATHASAKIYKCTDSTGKVFYSQSFDPKTCGGGGAQLNDQGLPIKTLERQKTVEEIAADRAQAKLDADAKVIAEAQAQQDRALMMSYTSEADLMRAQTQEIDVVEAGIATTKLSLSSQEKALAEILAHAASFERAKQPVPQVTSDQLKTVRHQMDATGKQLIERNKELIQIRDSYNQKLARYRELKTKMAGQRSGT